MLPLPAHPGLAGKDGTIRPLGIQRQRPGRPIQQSGVAVAGTQGAILKIEIPDSQIVAIDAAEQVNGEHRMGATALAHPQAQLAVLAMQLKILLVIVAGRHCARDKQIIKPCVLVIIDGIHTDLAEHSKAGPLHIV